MQLEVKDVTFSYGKMKVLDGVGFGVGSGESVCVLGPNGVGKSTLFNCVLGLCNRQFSGEILICGESVRSLKPQALAAMVAFVPQGHAPSFNYTVRDMVLMGTTAQIGGFSQPGKVQAGAAEAAMEQVGITALAGRGYTQISGGERQLTLIARALAQRAKILIMDEPTANLDFGNQIRVLSRIRKLAAQGYTIVQSTHNPAHARNYCDKVLALLGGRVEAFGAAADLLTDGLVCRLYGLTGEELRSYTQEREHLQ
jgi:iron complex transport system ATP-binding protein